MPKLHFDKKRRIKGKEVSNEGPSEGREGQRKRRKIGTREEREGPREEKEGQMKPRMVQLGYSDSL